LEIYCLILGVLVVCEINIYDVKSISPGSYCVLVSIFELDDLVDGVATWQLLVELLDKVADLLSGVDIDETSMSPLNNVEFIRHTQTILPIVSISVG